MKHNIATLTGLAMLGMTFQAFGHEHTHGKADEAREHAARIRQEIREHHHHDACPAHKPHAAKPGQKGAIRIQGLMVGPDGTVKRFSLDDDDAAPRKHPKASKTPKATNNKGIHLKFEIELDVDGAQVEEFLDRLEHRLRNVDFDRLLDHIAENIDGKDLERMMGGFALPGSARPPGSVRQFQFPIDPDQLRKLSEQIDPEQAEQWMRQFGQGMPPELREQLMEHFRPRPETNEQSEGPPEGPMMPPPEVMGEMLRGFAQQIKPEDIENLMKQFGQDVDPEQMQKMMKRFQHRPGQSPEGPKPPQRRARGPRAPMHPPHAAPRSQARRQHPGKGRLTREHPKPDAHEAEIETLRRELAEQQEMLRDLTEKLEQMTEDE